MNLLSIIVPVYNVEPYLARCLQSLQNQDLPKDRYEIIVVNDGSFDNSKDIVLEFVKKNNNIVLIDKENSGVSSARNAGIEKAEGEYIMFVDGDDYIEENILKFLTDYVIKSALQIGLFTLRNEGVENTNNKDNNLAQVVTGTELYRKYRRNEVDSSCTMLIERSLLVEKKIKYTSGIPYLEDGEFLARLMCVADRCAFFDYPYYIRVVRPNSATTSNLFFSEKAIDGFIKAAINLKDFRDNSVANCDKKEFMNQPIVKFVVTAVYSCKSLNTFKLLPYVKNKLSKNGFEKLDLSGCEPFHTELGNAYNISIYYYFFWRVAKTTLNSLVHKGKLLRKIN